MTLVPEWQRCKSCGEVICGCSGGTGWEAALDAEERRVQQEWRARNPGKTLHDYAQENLAALRDMGKLKTDDQNSYPEFPDH